MIWRLWCALLIVAAAGAWALAVPLSPPGGAKTASSVETYRQVGALPGLGRLKPSHAVGHDVFELPADDSRHLREAQGAGGGMAGMEGMEMGPGAEGQGDQAKPSEAAAEEHGGHGMDMAMPAPSEGAGHDEEAAGMAVPGGVEPEARGDAVSGAQQTGGGMAGMEDMEAGHGAEAVEAGPTAEGHGAGGLQMAMPDRAGSGGHGGAGEMAGISVLALGSSEEIARRLPGLAEDRDLAVAMTEWGYAPGHLMVAAGEVVRLSVRNDGRLPHEFMLMTRAGMAAVDYRIERADWNLLEHEAIAEMPIVMPGDSFELVARIERPGTWMFMCMFPYHMRLGMMGMIMTEGASMDGDMKM